jgi:hypothetical protein
MRDVGSCYPSDFVRCCLQAALSPIEVGAALRARRTSANLFLTIRPSLPEAE